METSLYQTFKLHLLHYIPLTKDAVHIYIGLTVYLTVGLLLRRLACWRPLLFVLGFAIAMEFFDLRDDLATFGYFRWDASFHDIANTTFWPVMVSLVLRLRRAQWRPEQKEIGRSIRG